MILNTHGKISFIAVIGRNNNRDIIGCQMRRANAEDIEIFNESKKVTSKQHNKRETRSKNKHPKTNKERSISVYISSREDLQDDAIVMTNKVRVVKQENIIKRVGELSQDELEGMLKGYNQYVKIQNLHKELHELKRKIAVYQFNNQNYSAYQKRLDEVLEELGFNHNTYKNNRNSRINAIPYKGPIRIYLGGRGGR